MNSQLSALIISDNFITSVTLSSILRKFEIGHIFETSKSTKALSSILEKKPNYIFIDSKIFTKENVAFDRMHVFSDALISILCLPEEQTDIEDILNKKDGNFHILSKPLQPKEIREILFKGEINTN